MSPIQTSVAFLRNTVAALARSGRAVLRFWCIPVLGHDDAAFEARARKSYYI